MTNGAGFSTVTSRPGRRPCGRSGRHAFFAAWACAVWLGACVGAPPREEPTPLVEFSPQLEVEEVWSLSVGSLAGLGDDRLAPALVDGTLYLADSRGQVLALEAATGRRLWEVELEASVTGATAAGAGLVVVGTKSGEVIGLDAASGQTRWKARVSSEVLAPPAVAPGTVVVQTIDGKLFGLAAEDGRRRWFYEQSEPALSLRGTASPQVVRGYVLAGFANGKVVALHWRDGRPAGEFVVAEPRGRNEIERLVDVDATPIVRDDALYAASFQGKVVAVDLSGGRLSWAREASVYTGLETDEQRVFYSDERGDVVALDRRSGATLWRQDKLRARHPSAPAVMDDYVVVGDFEGYVHWLAREDGRFAARYRLGGSGPIRTRPLVYEGLLIVAKADGHVSALRIRKAPRVARARAAAPTEISPLP